MYNQKLMPVFTGTLAGVSTQLVDARLLHTFIESNQKFSDWIKNRIKKYEFIQGIDFSVIHKFMNDGSAFGGKRKVIDYHLTLDMGKELSMLENNQKGKEARRYFIECEKHLLAQVPEHIVSAYDELVANLPPEHLNVIIEPMSILEFEARCAFHQNALENLKNVQVVISAKDFLSLKANKNV